MRSGRIAAAALAAAACMLGAAGAGRAGPDPGFGTFGAAFTGSGPLPFAVAADGQGRVVVAGLSGQSGFVERFTASGVPDAAFATNGVASFSSQVPSVAVDSQDRVVAAAGSSVVRLTTSGLPDTTFGIGGATTIAFGTGYVVRAVAVDASDRVVVAALHPTSGRVEVARLLTDGTVDSSFGLVDAGLLGGLASVAIGPDGRIFVAGSAGGNAAVVAVLPTGAIDTTFGSSGVATVDVGGNDGADAVAVDGAGDVVLGGTSVPGTSPAAGTPFVARLDSTGALDATFGTGGIAVPALPAGTGWLAQGLALGPGGRIALAGPTFAGTTVGGALFVLDANGAPDGGYVSGGLLQSSGFDTGVAFDSAGRLLLTGQLGPPVPTGFVRRFVDSSPDTTPPAVQIQSIKVGAVGTSGAVVTYTTSVFDDVDTGLSASCTPASGSVFPVGTTTISCTATDTAGNTGYASANVTVHPAPVVTVPSSPVTAEATGPSGAAVAFSASADEGGSPLPVSCSPASGSTFAVGDTTVTCSAQDVYGTSASATFTVTVTDTTAPVLTLPHVTVDATGPGGAAVAFAATAADLVDGAVPVSCTPASGTTFPIGNAPVSCTATDAHQNTASGSFVVEVLGAPQQLAALKRLAAPYPPLARRLATVALSDPRQACVRLDQFAQAALEDPGGAVGAALAVRARRIEAVLGVC